MSAPSTNIEKQSKRHRPAIWAMIAVGIFAAVLFLTYLANLSAQGNEPGETTDTAAPTVATDG
ncbi:hypothetical protein [Marivita sp.]|uniref:hypothetical protein n=1 Tax=Marivita sp. TaxID=2003365 RepID=UPI003F6BEF87